jgi:hypothetical protein
VARWNPRAVEAWQSSTFPKPGVRALTPTRFGWLAIGIWPWDGTTGCDPCRPTDPSLFVSTDGLTWVEHRDALPFDQEPSVIVDDEGMLAIGRASRL